MIHLLKTIIGFAIAFMILIPTCMVIDTVSTGIQSAADTYTQSGDNINVSDNVSSHISSFVNIYTIVYGMWGISFFVALFLAYRRERNEYDSYQ